MAGSQFACQGIGIIKLPAKGLMPVMGLRIPNQMRVKTRTYREFIQQDIGRQ
jgi:hypothetical protein